VLDAGLGGKAGVDLIADYETTLFNKGAPLASFDSCSNDPNAPRPALTWARSFRRTGSPGERAKAIIQLSDGTYFVVGDSDRFDAIDGYAAAVWALRLDALGNVMWQRAFQRLGPFGMAQGAAEVPGGVLVAASTGVMKLDMGGNLVWAKAYDAGQYLEIASLAARDDGTSLVAGRYGNTTRAWAMKLDDGGGVEWSRLYGGSGFARVRNTADGGNILVGSLESNANDVLLAKLDASGGLQWKRALDDRYDSSGGAVDNAVLLSGTDRGYDVVERPTGGYVIAAESYGSFPLPEAGQPGFFAPWRIEVDGSGELTSSTLFRAPINALYDTAYALVE